VNSILCQTYKNVEIIIVDDCSIDNSVEVCKKIADNNSNVIFIQRLQNGGQLPARNDGIKASTGKWILFLDSDDILQPDVLQKYCDILVKYNPDIVFTGYETVDSDNKKKVFRAEIKEGLYTPDAFGKFFFKELPMNVLTCVGSKIYKSEFLKMRKDITGEDIKTNADMAFIMDALLSCKTIYYLDEVCYTYLLRSDSITYSYRPDMYPLICRSRRRIKEYLWKCNCYAESEIELALMQYTLIRKALIQEIKFHKGFRQFKKTLVYIANDGWARETRQIICRKDRNLIHRFFLQIVEKKFAVLLYLILQVELRIA
jgi:glycosyltransferase involved in cell wall biosynthesis